MEITLNRAAIAPGAMYLPPEVLTRSFLRSVILRWPSSSSTPMSPVASQPSGSSVSALTSGRLR